MSAPATSRKNMSIPSSTKPLWINPCGSSDDPSPGLHDFTPFVFHKDNVNKEVLDRVIVMANMALADVTFKEEFVIETFKVEYEQHKKDWENHRYPWMPPKDKVVKKLGEATPLEHLESLEFDTSMQDGLKFLQVVSVALEQVVFDLNNTESKFAPNFGTIGLRLKTVMCELQTAMSEMNIVPHPDVERKVMPDEYRYTNSDTQRNLRDWMVLQESIRTLEHIREVIIFFLKKVGKMAQDQPS